MSNFGAGLGSVIGSSLAAGDLSAGQKAVDNTATGFGENTAGPYNSFGQSFLPTAANAINGIAGTAGSVQGYNDFIKNYQTTPAAQYQEQQADAVQNSGAAAKGQVLSGSNERALSTINQGIAAQNANTAYDEYLKGNSQGFGQLEQSLGNMFQAIGVGTTATGQIAGVDNAQIGATSQIAQAQAKNDNSKGSGIGSMFSGLGAAALAF